MTRAASTSRETTQDLVRDSERDSWISTLSPSLYWLASSCAWYFFERTTYLAVQRVLDAVFDQDRNGLVHLVAHDTCLPESGEATLQSLPLRSFRVRLLVQHGLHAGDVAAHLLQLAGVLQLLGGLLHAQAELRLQQARRAPCSARRRPCRRSSDAFISTPLLCQPGAPRKSWQIGSLAAARRNASRASSSLTPSISYSILPG